LEDFEAPPDPLPASYHYHETDGKGRKYRVVGNPAKSVPDFLNREMSLRRLGKMMQHLWLAGAKRPATQLHFQVAMGRHIVIVDRMDLHLVWDEKGWIFVKPVPRFLVDPEFWRQNLNCPGTYQYELDGAGRNSKAVTQSSGVDEQDPAVCRMRYTKGVALGFLYTYACLISSESDFIIANEKNLLPRDTDGSTIKWTKWKSLAREILEQHDPDEINSRFERAELRLSRINLIHRFTRLPPFDPYLRGWRDYSTLFRENLAWMATATIFIALVLTAMQVGLATDRLQGDVRFQRASYGFTVLALLGPMCAFGLIVLVALLNLVKDLPWALRDRSPQLRDTVAA
jgi:hypothetical protein